MLRLPAVGLTLSLVACTSPAPERAREWTLAPTARTGTRASLRGVSAVSRAVAWASGTHGTVLRTTDGGATWQSVGPRDAQALDLRSLHAFDADTALVASAGIPARVWRTSDGGGSWRLVHEDRRKEAFFDALAFGAGGEGLLVGDPVGGELVVLASSDRGETWQPVDGRWLPLPQAGEAMFAAGDCCLCIAPDGRACLVTGGTRARALVRAAGRAAWKAHDLPLAQGKASQGAFAVALDEKGNGVAVGGDYAAPAENAGTAAYSHDGGAAWHAAPTGALGYRSAVVFVPGAGATCVAAGSAGCSISRDGGRTWLPLGNAGYHALSAARDGSVWAAGDMGRVARLVATTVAR